MKRLLVILVGAALLAMTTVTTALAGGAPEGVNIATPGQAAVSVCGEVIPGTGLVLLITPGHDILPLYTCGGG